MLMPSGQYKIFVYAKALDFRKGMDGISGVCKTALDMNPFGGAVFLFFNRSQDRLKIFYHDGTGAVLFIKRLDRNRFKGPALVEGAAYATMHASELALLLEGVDVTCIRRPNGGPVLHKKSSKKEMKQSLAKKTQIDSYSPS